MSASENPLDGLNKLTQGNGLNESNHGSGGATHWRTPTVLLAALVLFWALEIALVQLLTTTPSFSLDPSRIAKDSARRMVLNLTACTALVCLLPRRWLYCAFLMSAVSSVGLITYANYFPTPLSWLTICYQWREGLAVTDHGLAIMSWPTVLLLVAALMFKVRMREWTEQTPVALPRRLRWATVAVCMNIAVAIGLVAHKPIHRINIGTPEYIYGYTVAWITEAISSDSKSILSEALAKAELRSDQLSKNQPLLEIKKNLAVVQIESLDYNVIEAEVDGKSVMPFLRDLKKRCNAFRVKPFHFTCSADADFSLLTTATPNGRVTPFQVIGFPYDTALPAAAGQYGYSTAAIHGNTGSFFHRRSAYSQMGFSQLFFTEELEPFGINPKEDDEVLQFSAKLMSETDQPTFHFIITITSHGPFNRVPDEQNELYRHPQNITQAYLNSMRYVDNSLKRYFAALPDRTTVVLYGDHESGVGGYTSDGDRDRSIPWLFCIKEDGAIKQPHLHPDDLPANTELSQLDMATYLRKSLEATYQIADQKEANTINR